HKTYGASAGRGSKEGDAIMSTPIKGDEGLLMYAPPWARERAQRLSEHEQASNTLSHAADPSPGNSNPHDVNPQNDVHPQDVEMDRPAPSPRASFIGDVAAVEMRRRLSLEPRLVPDPPFREHRRPRSRSSLKRLPLQAALAAIIAFAIVAYTRPGIISQ